MAQETRIEAFFLPVAPGKRFCLLHQPPEGMGCIGGIVYVPPFAEEMHKARRMAAMQARSFAVSGFAVLQPDLYGCGDSSGEFLEATVEIWCRDLIASVEWMRDRGYLPVHLWGLRFGALLACEVAQDSTAHVDGLLLWQPVANGDAHLTQFLRASIAADMLAHAENRGGVTALRKRLAAGETIEVAGYEIAPRLAAEMDRLKMADMTPATRAIDVLEVSLGGSQAALSAGSARVVDRWRTLNLAVACSVVSGVPFWSTVEITVCPELIEATTRVAGARCAVGTAT